MYNGWYYFFGFPQESQCQTLPSPGFTGHKHSRLVGLVRVREPGWPKPVLQTGVGELAPAVGRIPETRFPAASAPAAAPPSPSPPCGRQAQGNVHDGYVAPRGEHARRRRAGRERRVPSQVAGQEETSPSSPPSRQIEQQQILKTRGCGCPCVCGRGR